VPPPPDHVGLLLDDLCAFCNTDSLPAVAQGAGADSAVHGSRVLDHAGAREVVASAAVPVLAVGAGIDFEDRGEHELKGIPGTWRLYSVVA
jgi:hypothetical protein